jgi:drug/metabolite transporter (DMT)-like permease
MFVKKWLDKIPPHRKGLVYISFTALLWSSSGLFIKILNLDALQISFYRSGIAALTVLAVSAIRSKASKKPLGLQFDKISILSSFFYAGILIFFVIATKKTTAANAIFLQFTAPIYLLVLEPLFLKSKFEPKNLITIVVTIFGMILFFFGRLELGNIYGNIIAIVSGMCFACFALLLKKQRLEKKSVNTLNSVILGNVIITIIAFFSIYPNFALSSTEVLILLYMGIFQIGISYMIFNEGIKYVSATESMIIATMEAIFNPIWVFLGIGETPSIYAIAGGLIIMSAILWRNLSKRAKEKMIMVE